MKSLIILALFGLLVSLVECGVKPIRKDSVVAVEGDSTHLREYSAETDGHTLVLKGVELEKTGANTATVDAVEFILTDYNQSTLYFAYFHEEAQADQYGNVSAVAAAAFAMAMRTYYIFEFVDLNGIPGFQNGTLDQITGGYDLSSLALEWKPMNITDQNITDSNGNVFKVWWVTIETMDEVFLMRFVVTGTPAKVGDVDLTPDSSKIDFEIRWFTANNQPAVWTTGPSANPNAQVGMALAMYAAAETFTATNTSSSDNNSFEFATSGFVGYFTYDNVVEVTTESGTNEADVYADVVEATGMGFTNGFAEEWLIRICFFSFGGIRPSDIVWDPQLGTKIDYKTDTTGKTTAGTTGNSNVIMASWMMILMAIVMMFNL